MVTYSYNHFLCILSASIFWIIYLQLGQRDIIICMALCLLVLTLENYGASWNTMKEILEKYRSKKDSIHTSAQKHQEITNLFIFQALKYHTIYSIDDDTSDEVIDALLQEVNKTKIFTMLFHYNSQRTIKYMHVEFVQNRYSYVVSIPLTFAFPNGLREKINLLYHRIFLPSNIHQIWGNIDYELKDYIEYQHLSLNVFDVQEKFKQWYNDTFPHEAACRQVSIDKDIDGRPCTCSCRPYKSVYDQWSLSRAVHYTFDITLDHPLNETQQCFAVTQLASMVREDWSTYELEIYLSMQFRSEDVAN